MVFGQNGVNGHSVLSLVVEVFKNDQEYAHLPSIMASGVRATALKQSPAIAETVLVSQNIL